MNYQTNTRKFKNIPIQPSNSGEADIIETVIFLPHDSLHDALFYIHDNLERASIPYMVGGDLALTMFEHGMPFFQSDKVEVLVPKKNLTYDCYSMLNSLIKLEKTDFGYKTQYKEVPIYINVIESPSRYFTNPDTRIYYVEEFKLPNPFMEYWENKDTIK